MSELSRTAQSAALPYRIGASGEIELLLVTSRTRKRWVLPKGKIKPGVLPQASAAREAYEEAGIIGVVSNTPLGTYRQSSSKTGSVRPTPVRACASNHLIGRWPRQ